MELLLVRHGKAQERGTVTIDSERKLLPKGIIQLKQDMPYLAEYLKGRKKVHLWSSSIRRAKETAEIIKEICEIDDIEFYDFIETGNFRELALHLKQMEKDSTVIIVGHEPDLSLWCGLISGKDIPFKKGSAVLLKLLTVEELTGEIQWIAEPAGYKRMLKNNNSMGKE